MANTEIVTSVHNLPRGMALGGNSIDYANFVHTAGSSGYQYMPMRTAHGYVGKHLAKYGLIRSLHQSWFSVRSAKDLALAPVIPTMRQSVDVLAQVQAASKHPTKKLPIVVHPNEQYLDDRPQRQTTDYKALAQTGTFGPLLHQPTVEIMTAWGVMSHDPEATAAGMLEAQREKGFGGIALDLYHLTAERTGRKLASWWCEQFAGSLAAQGALARDSEVQLSFRPDWGEEWANVYNAEQGRLRETPQGRMLTTINEALPSDQTDLRLTLEFPASAFKPLNMDAALGNRIIADEARQLLA